MTTPKQQELFESEDNPTIFDTPVRTTETSDEDMVYEKFLKFHKQNPHVLKAIINRCREIKNEGMEQWSIAGIFEQLRWSYLKTFGDDEFKISNDYKPFYARLVMYVDSYLDDFFIVHKRPLAKDEPDNWIENLAKQEHENLKADGLDLDFNYNPSFKEDLEN